MSKQPQVRSTEAGSLPMVLLVALVLAGVVIAVGISTRTGADTARQDRDFNAAVHVADAGVQEAYTTIAQVTAEQEDLPPGDPDLMEDGDTLEGDGVVEGEPYTWLATFDGTTSWEVVSTGRRGGSARTLVADIGAQQLHPLALYAETAMGFNGLPSGTAQAFDAAGGGVDVVNMDYLLGSSGAITVNGQCNEGIVLHGDATINTDCDPEPEPASDPDLDWDPAKDAFNEGGACYDDDADERIIDDATFKQHRDADALEHGRTYCVSEVNIHNGARVEITGNSDDGPAEIYIEPSGDFSFSSGGTKAVNVPIQGNSGPDIAGGDTPPDTTALRVYMSGGEFGLRSNSHFGGILWAPTTACSASNGNTYTYGALVCGTFNNNGNWSHWYDVAAGDIHDGRLVVNSYREDASFALD